MSQLTERHPLASPPIASGRPDVCAPASCGPSTASLLTWAFTFFNSIRVLSYLPTWWAMHGQGESSQYSLLTWLIWTGANATMALWLYEQNARHFNCAIAVNACNAAMCLTTSALIVFYRL